MEIKSKIKSNFICLCLNAFFEPGTTPIIYMYCSLQKTCEVGTFFFTHCIDEETGVPSYITCPGSCGRKDGIHTCAILVLLNCVSEGAMQNGTPYLISQNYIYYSLRTNIFSFNFMSG